MLDVLRCISVPVCMRSREQDPGEMCLIFHGEGVSAGGPAMSRAG